MITVYELAVCVVCAIPIVGFIISEVSDWRRGRE